MADKWRTRGNQSGWLGAKRRQRVFLHDETPVLLHVSTYLLWDLSVAFLQRQVFFLDETIVRVNYLVCMLILLTSFPARLIFYSMFCSPASWMLVWEKSSSTLVWLHPSVVRPPPSLSCPSITLVLPPPIVLCSTISLVIHKLRRPVPQWSTSPHEREWIWLPWWWAYLG